MLNDVCIGSCEVNISWIVDISFNVHASHDAAITSVLDSERISALYVATKLISAVFWSVINCSYIIYDIKLDSSPSILACLFLCDHIYVLILLIRDFVPDFDVVKFIAIVSINMNVKLASIIKSTVCVSSP
jgi:hypothetical protein